jgi:membrane protease YdiL (CAAX protease family)
MTTDSTPADSLSPSRESAPLQPSIIHRIFLGPREIRSGWRLLIYLVLVAALVRGFGFVNIHVAPIREWLSAQPTDVITATPQIYGECIFVLSVFIPALIMAKIEKRRFAEYGLPAAEAFGKRFWQGVPFGFAMMSLLVAGIAVFRGYSMEGVGASGGEAVKFGILYAIGFLLVGFFEEFGFRGYLQYTLGSSIGFWPSAIILSVLFGAAHLGNPGEARIGAVMAGCFGLLALFSLRRTGSLWFAVGMHAGFDWTETFFYGVPDSGLLAQGHFLNSAFHGSPWLTGGSVGPEGSYIVFGVLVISAVAIHYMFPAQQKAS